jgi:hypothetical protein
VDTDRSLDCDDNLYMILGLRHYQNLSGCLTHYEQESMRSISRRWMSLSQTTLQDNLKDKINLRLVLDFCVQRPSKLMKR